MSTVGSTCAVILAAGKGTRMKSSLPKVLHPLMGKPVLSWVIAAVKDAGVSEIALVLGSDTTRFQQLLKENPGVRVAVQKGQKGTGDAVASASGAFIGVTTPSYAEGELRVGSPIKAEWLLVVTGDTPAISAKTLKEFIASTLHSGKRLGVLGMEMPDPRGYGRLIKGPSGGLTKIVEERDADSETRKIQLCNSGIMMAKASWLFELLGQVAPHNSQNEYYLTDIFLLAANSQAPAHIFETKSDHEFAGINDRMQLEALEEWMLERRRRDMMSSGVTLH
ncbi:MAG: NTP transferase domain-containing protein, partial [Proteobacteria bacterium]|nr:NTP transferase domain-containing protein [Pseudomonadota bacterium]